LKLLSFLKTKHWIYKDLGHLKKSYLLKNDKNKIKSCTWTTIRNYYNKLQKKLFQNSFIWKKFFGGKKHVMFLWNNHVGSL
jgi:hypothetical protein